MYSHSFYKSQSDGSLSSAEAIIPYVIDLVHPKSVVDVGCGVATWLSVFNKMGIDDILGLDGEWVDMDLLMIDKANFHACDLTTSQHTDKTFDLAMSLEVAEHLPESSASTFVNTLTGFSNIVLFAAAVPGQRGTKHINCQWPEYWVTLFKENGYIPIDIIRSHIWQDDRVEYWYRQNMFIFVNQEYLHTFPILEKGYKQSASIPLSIVHPQCFLRYAAPSRMSLLRTVAALPKIVYYSLKRQLKRRTAKRK